MSFDASLKLGSKKLHEKRELALDLDRKYRKKFFVSGTIKKSLVEKRDCPICKFKNKKILFVKDGGTHKKCKKCEIIYLDPAFKDKELENFYKFNVDSQSTITANEKAFYIKMYSGGIKNILKKRKIKTLLDVGCSTGLSLDLAKKNNIKTYGIELNDKEATIAEKNHKIYRCSIFKFSEKIKFDVITMWDVIEHIKDTHALLRKIHKMLKKGGLFFFQTPNAHSLANSILHDRSNCFDGIEHVNLFSLKSINMISKKNKFKIIDIRTVISEIPIIQNYLNFENPYLGDSKCKKLFSQIDEKKMHDLLLGYKFQAILKKQ